MLGGDLKGLESKDPVLVSCYDKLGKGIIRFVNLLTSNDQ